MRNLLPLLKTLEEPDDIANILDEKEFLHDRYWRNYGHYWYGACIIDGIDTYQRVENTCKKYIGKPFDDAFSDFCKQVPKHQQEKFLEKFENRHRYWRDIYSLDDNGNIIYSADYRSQVWAFESPDYRTEWRHPITKDKKTATMWWHVRDLEAEGYEQFVISGYRKVFASRWDKEFIQLKAERQKAARKRQRLRAKERKKIQWSFLTREELERQKEKQENLSKIQKHGFDVATSFRNNVSPEAIEKERGY